MSDSDRDALDLLILTEIHSTAAVGLLDSYECRDAYLLEYDGADYVCLTKTDLRIQAGALAVAEAMPGEIQGIASTKVIRSTIETMAQASDARPRILQSVWHVPLVWFVPFDQSERTLMTIDDDLVIKYFTEMSTGLSRVSHAIEILSQHFVPQVTELVKTLERWLLSFDRQSILQLDYASVATLFTPDELADDASAFHVSSAISELADGNGDSATFHYLKADERWQRAKQVPESN